MLSLRISSLMIASSLVLSALGCGDGSGGSGGTGGQATGTETGGGDSGGSTAGSGGTGGSGATGGSAGSFPAMTLTSPDISEGGMIPAMFTCAGQNISPQLDWTAGPPQTKSYSLIFKDETIGLVHSAIWDIAGDALGLPEDVEKAQNPTNVPGAKQAEAYDNQTFGYLGPCPGGTPHNYRFTVYALDVSTLPVIGVPAKESIVDLSQEHMLASAALAAQSDAKQ